ncbi:MAG: hypothetical protein UU82_C0042G0005 [Candidatus Nomurabacteria bacterium GW2011_GWC2_41_8]|uniref:Bacterial spore germination immunoglobulin-like domain-containing protein n=2 Tax=Candidatus Nomuraibacteriota TaxID=1752729 RepID=A0A0G0XDP2_9BACT|nr:MAG: hypothetical protein UU82_C0042G0005 [Candidatus Nomurabacteria bacterium GW2011_GWC2_41_8]
MVYFNMLMKIKIIIAVGVLVIGIGYFAFYFKNPVPAGKMPAQNLDQNLQKITYNNATTDLIIVELPFPGAVTGKEFSVIGKARGNWFFEASFPITLLDKNGNMLVETYATAQGEWMTTDFVPFKSEVKAPIDYIGPATLILKKDNPSDMREFDASISFPITIEY